MYDDNGLCHGFELNDSERFVVGFQFHLERNHEEFNPDIRFQPPSPNMNLIMQYYIVRSKFYKISK